MDIVKRVSERTGKVSYRATVTLGRDRNGKRVRITKSFPKKELAKKWIRETELLKGKSQNLSELGKKALSFYFEKYLEDVHLHATDNTYKTYLSSFQKWINPYFGYMKFNQVTVLTIEKFMTEMILKGASSRTVNFTLNRLSCFYDWSKKNQLFQINVVENVSRPKIKKKNRDQRSYHSSDEVLKILEYAKEKSHYHDLIFFLYNSGLRIAEACALRVQDFDYKHGSIRVANQLVEYIPKPFEIQIEGHFLGPTKSANERQVFLNSPTTGLLRKLCEDLENDEFVFRPKAGKERNIILSRGIRSKVKQSRIILPNEFTNDVFKPIQKKSGVENILGVHGTRRTFGSHFVMNGGQLEILQKILGHKSIETTQAHYAHLSDDYMKGSRDVVSFQRFDERPPNGHQVLDFKEKKGVKIER